MPLNLNLNQYPLIYLSRQLTLNTISSRQTNSHIPSHSTCHGNPHSTAIHHGRPTRHGSPHSTASSRQTNSHIPFHSTSHGSPHSSASSRQSNAWRQPTLQCFITVDQRVTAAYTSLLHHGRPTPIVLLHGRPDSEQSIAISRCTEVKARATQVSEAPLTDRNRHQPP